MNIAITLLANSEGDGLARLHAEWIGMDSVARLDLLQDWSSLLKELHAAEHAKLYGSSYTPHPPCVDAIFSDGDAQ